MLSFTKVYEYELYNVKRYMWISACKLGIHKFVKHNDQANQLSLRVRFFFSRKHTHRDILRRHRLQTWTDLKGATTRAFWIDKLSRVHAIHCT